MSDGFIQVPPDSTGKKLDTTELAVGANTVERERLVVSGSADVELADVKNDVPSTSAFGLVTRTAMGSSATVLGGVAVLGGATGNLVGYTLTSTGLAGAAVDPRQSTIVAATSGAGLGTILSTGVGGAAIDPRAITQASTWDVRTIGAGSSAVTGTSLISTGLAGAAIDPRQSTIVGGTSGLGLGTIVSTGAGAAAIDPRQATIVAATSGAVLWTVGAGSSGVTGTSLISTALAGAAIDPRQATIVAATSGAGLGTILSTGVGGAAIDPRAITQASTWDVRIIGAASSGVLGTVLSATGLTGAAIDVRQVTVVAGTSGLGLGTIVSTGAGGAAIDPRQVTIIAATSGAFVSTRWSTQTTNGSTVIDTANEAVRVNVVAGGAGGGVADLQVRSTSNVWTDVGYLSGNLVLPIGITTGANSTTIIDPRAASLTASSSQVFPIQMSTGVNTAYIDPRIVTPSSQWTITAAFAAGSTVSAAPTSQWTVSIAGTASSAVLGTVLISTGLTGAAVDPRQVTVIGGTSGTGIGTIISTAAGAAAIDPRQVTVVAGTSGAYISVLNATGVGGAAIDPRIAYGDVSSGSTVGVNPLGLGGRAATANPSTVADGGRTWLMTDAVGRLVTVASHVRGLSISTGVTVTTTSETSILAAAGSSVYHDITFLSITNRSTSNVVRVVLSASSGSGSSGYNFTLAERGGIVIPFNPPLYQQTANSAWCLTVVSGASTVDVSIQAVKNTPS